MKLLAFQQIDGDGASKISSEILKPRTLLHHSLIPEPPTFNPHKPTTSMKSKTRGFQEETPVKSLDPLMGFGVWEFGSAHGVRVCVCVDLCCQEVMSVAVLQGAISPATRPTKSLVAWCCKRTCSRGSRSWALGGQLEGISKVPWVRN